MTDMTAYPYPSAPAPAPQQQDEDVTDSPGPVLVLVAGPAPQRRATVAFRLILAIPHLLALYALGGAAGFVLIIGWLGALVTRPAAALRRDLPVRLPALVRQGRRLPAAADR